MSGWLEHPGAAPVRDALIRSTSRMGRGGVHVQVQVNPLEDMAFNPGAAAVFLGEEGRPVYLAIASAPSQLPVLDFHVGEGVHADAWLSREGEAVRVQFPVGEGYPLETMVGKPVVFVGMGSGIAPLRSAILHMLGTPSRYPDIHLLQGIATEDSLPFSEDLNSWMGRGVRIIRTVTRARPQDPEVKEGRVQDHFEAVLPEGRDCWVVLCGSGDMIAESRERLEALGVDPARIVTNW